jgi:hypothetical protein
MPPSEEIQAKSSEGEPQEKEEPNKELVQTKLTVGAPGDKYEQEADSMAAKVMRMPDEAIQQPIQRQTGEDTEAVQMQPLVNSITPLLQRSSGEEEEVQMKSGAQRASDGSSVASGNVENQLAGSKGGGSPLPDDVRSYMEPRFGADFSSVRVHTDSNAVQMNKELGAQAFAHGSDIYYGAGKSPGKNELTAHELTHTIQQTGAAQLNKSVLPKPEPEQEQKQPLQAKKLSSSTPEVIQNKLGTGIAPRIQANQQRQSTEPSQFSTTQSESMPLQRAPGPIEGSARDPLILRLSEALGELSREKEEDAINDRLALSEAEIELLVKSAGDWNQVKNNYLSYPNLMGVILEYRKREVSKIVGQVYESNEQFDKLDMVVGNAIVRNNPTEMVAAGSNDPTSDYDVTFSAGAGNEKLEILAVREFNKLFRNKWILESGIVFDTNVYTSGHMRSAAFKGDGEKLKLINNLSKKLDKILNENTLEYPEKRDEINDLVAKINGLGNEGTPIKLAQLEVNNVKRFSQQIIDLQNNLVKKVGQQYKDSKESYGAGEEFDELAMVMSLVHMKEFWEKQPEGYSNWTDVENRLVGNKVPEDGDKVPEDVKILNRGRLKRTSEIHTELVNERNIKIDQAREQLRQENPELANNEASVEMRASNLLYEEYLQKVEKKLAQIRTAEQKLAQIRPAEQSEEQRREASKQVNALKLELQELQSKALFFANEAYMAPISAEQVVLNQQIGLNVELPTAQYLASINEQTAFVGEQIAHIQKNFGKALWKTAKYVDRILVAIKTISAQTVKVAPSEEIMKKVDQLVPLVEILDKHIKKNPDVIGADKDKEAKNLAEKDNNSSVLGASTLELARNILNLVIDVNISVQSHLNRSRNSKPVG